MAIVYGSMASTQVDFEELGYKIIEVDSNR